jgi:hypothetical protein
VNSGAFAKTRYLVVDVPKQDLGFQRHTLEKKEELTNVAPGKLNQYCD